MISFYFKKEEYEKASLLMKELEITDNIVSKTDLEFLKIVLPYLAQKEIDENVTEEYINEQNKQ